MKNCVFVHTNHRQMVGALVSQYSLKRNSRDPDAFDVRIIDTKDQPFLHAREGQHYLRDGVQRQWLIEDLQSFTPLRFMPPELMGYQGRAVVIDPDVFAVGDVNELLTRDMAGKALMCRARKGPRALPPASCCSTAPSSPTGAPPSSSTDVRIQARLHGLDLPASSSRARPSACSSPSGTTSTSWTRTPSSCTTPSAGTSPGRPACRWTSRPTEGSGIFRALGWVRRARASLFGRYALLGQYKRHWDPNQERFFFGLLRECLDKGVISEAMLREEMERNHVRHDAFEVLERTPRLAA